MMTYDPVVEFAGGPVGGQIRKVSRYELSGMTIRMPVSEPYRFGPAESIPGPATISYTEAIYRIEGSAYKDGVDYIARWENPEPRLRRQLDEAKAAYTALEKDNEQALKIVEGLRALKDLL